MLLTRASHMIMRSQKKHRSPNLLPIQSFRFRNLQFLNQLFKLLLLNQLLNHKLLFRDQFTMQLVFQCKLLNQCKGKLISQLFKEKLSAGANS